MGNFKAWVRRRDDIHHPVNPAEPRGFAVLKAGFGHHLHAHANAQKGFCLFDHRLNQRVHKARLLGETSPTILIGTNARQDNMAGFDNVFRLMGKSHLNGCLQSPACHLHSLESGVQIARPIVNDYCSHKK